MLNPKNLPFRRQAGEKLTNHARNSFIKADWLARKFNHGRVDNIHLLYAIFLEKGSMGSNILKDLGMKKETFEKSFAKEEPGTPDGTADISASEDLKKTFTRAYGIAKDFSYPYVGTEHLIYALIDSSDRQIKDLLAGDGIKDIGKMIASLFDPNQIPDFPKIFEMPEISLGKISKKASATPSIDKFCTNINREIRNTAESTIGRDPEIGRMINILGRKNKNNPLLIGEPGVGKTALVWGLAERINSAAVPPSLYGKRIMNLDLAQLIAGTSFRGEFESRLKEIIKEVSKNKDIILFIDEFHTVVGTGNVSGGLDLANIIKPALARGQMQLIGATTFAEFKKYIEKDAALERRFQPVQIAEPTRLEAEKILLGIKKHYEKFHNVILDDESIRLAVELSVRYIQNRFLPDKAIDVIDEAASNIRSKGKVSDLIRTIKKLEDEKLSLLEQKDKLVEEEDYEKAISLRSQEKKIEERIKELQADRSDGAQDDRIAIRPEDILETVSRMSGVPLEKLSQEKNKKIKNVRRILEAEIIGQPEAIEKLSSTLLRSQSGVTDPDRPLGSFLFLGPTGVGKTLTAKVLAKEYFGSSKSLIRIDMSELMERHSVASLIGSPAGYIGYGEGGNLTEKVRRNPYSVILFDEIEKAHPDVFNILLQILEDGILTDAEGTAVNFKNTIIILTSNIGTGDFTQEASKVGFELQTEAKKKEIHEKFNEIKNDVLDDLEDRLRPELLNRLDHILVFDALGRAEIRKIASKEIKKLAERLAKQKIKLVYKADVINFIAGKSLAFNRGARLIRKNIQELLENKIAEMIVYDKVKNGKITLAVKREDIKLS